MFGDFLRVIGASLGWAAEVTLDVAKAYLRFLQKAIVPSLIVGGIGTGALLLSEGSQVAGFNAFGLILIGAVLLFWLAAAQPVVEGAILLGEIAEPVKRICDRMTSAILALGVLILTTLHMPPGIAGLQRIGVLVVFLLGAMLLGFQITRKAIGIKLVVIAGLMTAAIILPGAFSSLGSILPAADVTLKNAVVPRNKEILLTLESIAGRDRSAPRLFIDGGPNWYCLRARESSAGYRCFQYPGRDEVTNEPLVPITREIVDDIRARLLLAKSRADAEAVARDEAAEERATQAAILKEGAERRQKEAAEERVRHAALLKDEAERRQKEAAQAEWRSFHAGLSSAPSSWSENPSWRNNVDGKQVHIKYTDHRRQEALEIARLLNALGADVTHSRTMPSGNKSMSQLMYSFSNYEAADTIRAAAIKITRLELLSSDSGVRQIDIVLQ